jgi:hypothetical protein
MAQSAAHMVNQVIANVPVRQWVLPFPGYQIVPPQVRRT